MDIKNKIQFVYTDEAAKLMRDYNRVVKEYLEATIRDKKYVYGDDLVEITASDIKSMVAFFEERTKRKLQRNQQFSQMLRLVIPVYGVLGIFLALAGIFFDKISTLVASDPLRASIILLGLMMIFITAISTVLLKQRERVTSKLNNNENVATTADLQAQINALLEQIYTLQSTDERTENRWRLK